MNNTLLINSAVDGGDVNKNEFLFLPFKTKVITKSWPPDNKRGGGLQLSNGSVKSQQNNKRRDIFNVGQLQIIEKPKESYPKKCPKEFRWGEGGEKEKDFNKRKVPMQKSMGPDHRGQFKSSG